MFKKRVEIRVCCGNRALNAHALQGRVYYFWALRVNCSMLGPWGPTTIAL